jgi:hypothetical protein
MPSACSTWAAMIPDEPAPMMQAVACRSVMSGEATRTHRSPGSVSSTIEENAEQMVVLHRPTADRSAFPAHLAFRSERNQGDPGRRRA